MSKRRSRSRRGNLRPASGPRERTPNATARSEKERRYEQTPHWELSSVAGNHELKLTAECIADIAECITRIGELSTSRRLTPSSFQRQIRQISVPVRKLILSSDELLLRRCFVPRMHPLRIPKNHEPNVISEWMGNIEIGFTVGSSAEERRISFPTEHSHETVVRPLHGLRRIGEKQFQLEDPFDWSAELVKDSLWLNSKVLQIDDLTLTTEQLLRMMVNREGAHSERNGMLGLQFSAPVRISLPDAGDEAYSRANTIKFSQLSYIQIFTYLVGIYLVNMMRASLKHIPPEVARYSASIDTWDTIIGAPAEPTRQSLHLEKDYMMGAVFHNTGGRDHPIELVGDYEATGTTMIQIPGRE